MKSKENKVLELFFNTPKHWHFEELLNKAKITRPQLARWLKKLAKEGIIQRVKEKGKMPYYMHDFNNPRFDVRKRMYASQMLMQSGLFENLASLKKAKAVILFGSFTRSDWYRDSDIDLFIYGSADGFNKVEFEMKLRRDIQLHIAQGRQDLKRMEKMLPYIVSGDFIKGSIQDIGVEVHAKS